MDTFYCSEGNFCFNNNDGVMSIEFNYHDSDGADVGAYAEGNSFDQVLNDVLDQFDEALADQDDARADLEEAEKLQAQIDDLTTQLNELKSRNVELEKETEKYKKYQDFENAINNFSKQLDTDDIWKHWFH